MPESCEANVSRMVLRGKGGCKLPAPSGTLRKNIIMITISREQVDTATTGNEWSLGNQILYDMCRKYPQHKRKSEIVAKIWIIGRSYAAAIERRKNTKDTVFDGNDFYTEKVAPEILKSGIDSWLHSLKGYDTISESNIATILLVHRQVTDLFLTISGLEKRSLASKYLHFHYPDLFFIYDSRAAKAVSKLSNITGRVGGRAQNESDNEYRKFCTKCLKIREHIKHTYEVHLTPRSLDNLLLRIEANT